MHSVCAINGGFSNHVRWLMLLSNEYNGQINTKGFVIRNSAYPIDTLGKVEFIKKFIYPDNRNFYNWIRYELMLKDQLETIIMVAQVMGKHKNPFYNVDKTILLRSSGEFCTEKFMKLHPHYVLELKQENKFDGLNSVIGFLDGMDSNNGSFIPKEGHKILTCYSETLYNELLDKEFYENMVNFFNISNEYEHAKDIHRTWYKCHIRARKECIDWITNSSYPDYPWDSHYLNRILKGSKLSIEDYTLIKDTLKQTYGVA